MTDLAVVFTERHVEMPVRGFRGPTLYHERHDLQGGNVRLETKNLVSSGLGLSESEALRSLAANSADLDLTMMTFFIRGHV